MAFALKQFNANLADDGDDLDLIKSSHPKALRIGNKIKAALRDVWKDAATDVFDIRYISFTRGKSIPNFYVSSQDDVTHVDRLAEEIGIIQDLKNSYHPILNVILLALDAPPVFMRTKALRALGQIVTSDPTILSTVSIQITCVISFSHILRRPMSAVELRAICLTAPQLCAMLPLSSLEST